MLGASSIDWTNVLVALIAGLPAIIAAVGVVGLHRQVRTPSGTSIGRQVEDALHVALANNLHLRAVGDTVDAPVPPAATEQEGKVPTLTDEGGG